MPDSRDRNDAERRRGRLLGACALVLAILGLSAGISQVWAQRAAECSLAAAANALMPALKMVLADPEAPLPPLPDTLRVTLLAPDGSALRDSREPVGGQFSTLHARPEVLGALNQGEGLHVDMEGAMSLCRAVRDPAGRLVGLVLFRSTIADQQVNRISLFGLLVLLLLLVTASAARLIHHLGQPRRELLAEIERLSSGNLGDPIFLPIHHLYRPVADTINRLSDALERQNRVLAEQHHQRQVLLNGMSEGILVLDNDLRITGVNPGAAQWLELGNPMRVRGKPLYTLCRNPVLIALVDDLIATGTLREEVLRLERPGEEDRLVQVKGSPLIDRDQTVGVLLVMQDVTTLRRLETLRQDFVANVSHELRTPLTAIKGYAELLCESPNVPEEVARGCERILAQSTRMVNIIDDLLALTRIENAESPPAQQRTDLRPLLENVLNLCAEGAARRELEMVLTCEDGLAPLLHAPLFEQAVHNLVHNAIKYTHPRTRVDLRAYTKGDRVVVEVEDRGPGIAAQHLPRLFERFYRVDKARSRAVGGTGLGLSIVKHIAQLHHGTVGVRSTPGQGSVFWIELPA